MRATNATTTSRTLARTIRDVAVDFLEPRVANALESTAEELAAKSSLADLQSGPPTETLNQDLRTLRRLTDDSAARYCHELAREIESRLQNCPAAEKNSRRAGTSHSRLDAAEGFEVALISDDELELSVMVSTVASRFERRNREALEDALAGVAARSDEARAEAMRGVIGVFPLINRFSRLLAASDLSLGTRTQLTHAFQFHVLEELTHFYRPLAERLHKASPAVAAPGTEPAGHRHPASLSDWSQLLHGGASSPAYVPGQAGLETYLSEVDFNAMAAGHGLPLGDGTAAAGISLYEHVLQVIRNQHGTAPSRLPALDMDVLQLVSLFFDTFLNDESLAPPLRFLLSRLQMPVLRLALAEGGFFDDKDHEARRLMEVMCRLGAGWASDIARLEHNAVYREVHAAVDGLADHPAPDAATFQAALERLEELHETRQSKASRAEGRVVELEVGRAKLKAARLVVQDVLNECLERHQGAEVLRTFFAESWSKVLTFVCLRHGCDSQAWQAARDLCEELAETFAPAGNRDQARRRTQKVPHLLERLESHMVEAGLSSTHVDQSLDSLYREIDQVRDADEAWFASETGMVVEQATLPRPITLIPEPVRSRLNDDDQAALLDTVRPGAWVRIHDESASERYEQVKVAARVAETREILLVDERGARWGLWEEAEFAEALEAGRVTLVDPEHLVQATLDAMIAQLTRTGGSDTGSKCAPRQEADLNLRAG